MSKKLIFYIFKWAVKQRRKQPLARAIDGNIMKKEQPEYLHMFIKFFQHIQNVLSHLVVHGSFHLQADLVTTIQNMASCLVHNLPCMNPMFNRPCIIHLRNFTSIFSSAFTFLCSYRLPKYGKITIFVCNFYVTMKKTGGNTNFLGESKTF